MADPQHMEWLLEAAIRIDLWNLKVANGKFRPDFAGTNLFNEFHEAGKIEIGEKLPLAKADFGYADFTGAVLSYADLTGADLQRAKLTGVDLWEAVLADANLYGANLVVSQLWNQKGRGGGVWIEHPGF